MWRTQIGHPGSGPGADNLALEVLAEHLAEATYTIRTRSGHTHPVRVHDATTIADSFGGSSYYAAAASRSSRSASV